VADTSVLINLCRVSEEELLVRLFREICAPVVVADEFARLAQINPRFDGLVLPPWVRLSSPGAIPPQVAHLALDPGETEAIALALEIGADAVLIDESAGRAAAHKIGLRLIGIVGVLLMAKASGVIPSVQPLLHRLRCDAGFWISPRLEAEVLRRAGETP